MPFKNKRQMRACFAKDKKNWDCKKWAHDTPNLKDLPEEAGFRQWLDHAEYADINFESCGCPVCEKKKKKIILMLKKSPVSHGLRIHNHGLMKKH